MKNMRVIVLLIFSIQLIACGGPVVTFEKPQPEGKSNLTTIPKRLQGLYICPSSNKQLEVTDKLIIETYELVGKVSKLDSNIIIVGDSVTFKGDKFKCKATIVGDSVIFKGKTDADTIFSIGNENVLRKCKGYYFLNNNSENGWHVRKMFLKKGLLSISRIGTKEDIDKLKTLTEIKTDTMPYYNIQISKRKFKEYIRHGGFDENETYIKIKNAPQQAA